MTRRRTYICRFWNAPFIHVSAVNEFQARKIANAIAAKPENNWKLKEVGILIR